MKTERRQRILVFTLVTLILGIVLTFIMPRYFADSIADRFVVFGSTLITACLIALVLERISFQSLVEEINDRLDYTIEEQGLRNGGLRSIVRGQFYDSIYEKVKCTDNLLIIQTWLPDITSFLDISEDIIKRGGKVRIFLLHPKSVFAMQRGVDLGSGSKQVPDKTRCDTRDVRSRYRKIVSLKYPGSLELFYYDALPALAIYKIDKHAWVGSYWYGIPSDSRSTLVIDIPSDLWKDYEEHIQRLEFIKIKVSLEIDNEPDLPKSSLSKIYHECNNTDNC